MGTEALQSKNNAMRFRQRTRQRRQVRQYKSIIEAAQNGDLNAVRHFVEEQHVNVNDRVQGNYVLNSVSAAGHFDIVQYLVSRGADVNATDKFRYNSLLWALDSNKASFDLIKFLIESGATVNIKSTNGYTPLHWAAANNRLDVVKYLVDMKADVGALNNDGRTPLQLAVEKGNSETSSFLSNIKNVRFDSGNIFDAAANGDVAGVRYFVETDKMDPFAKSITGDTALHRAASNGRLEVVKYLLELKNGNAKVNIQNASGETALFSACLQGHLSVIRYLIEDKHANPDATQKAGYTPLMVAAASGHLNIVRYLVTWGNVNVNVKEQNANTVLHIAAQYGHLNIVVFLVDERKVSIYLKNKMGDTALHVASRLGKVDIVKYFIDGRGMDITLANTLGRNILQTAVEGGSFEVVKYLVNEKRADIAVTDSNQNTILHIAIEFNRLQIVKYLLEQKGFDPSLRNGAGFDAMVLAQMYSQEILTYLIYERGIMAKSSESSNKPDNSNPLSISSVAESNNYSVLSSPKEEPNSDYMTKSPYIVIKPPLKYQAKPTSNGIYMDPQEQVSYQFNLQLQEETNTIGNHTTVRYFVNGKEVDKATRDAYVSQFMTETAVNGKPQLDRNQHTINDGNGAHMMISQKVTWSKLVTNNATGQHVQYVVNGQPVDQSYYDSIVQRYGSGNVQGTRAAPSVIAQTNTLNSVPVQYSWSNGGNVIPMLGYYNGLGRRQKRNTHSPSECCTLSKPFFSSERRNVGFLNSSESSMNRTSHNVSSEVGATNVHNFLTLLNFAVRQVIGNKYQQPKHESSLDVREILDNRIDEDAINAVNGLYLKN